MAGYTEQAGAKANMGELEYLNPMSQDYLDKLEHIRGAVAHHMYEEESARFLDLKKLSPADQARLTERYAEEFDRYCRGAPDGPDSVPRHVHSPVSAKGPDLHADRH